MVSIDRGSSFCGRGAPGGDVLAIEPLCFPGGEMSMFERERGESERAFLAEGPFPVSNGPARGPGPTLLLSVEHPVGEGLCAALSGFAA